MRVIPRELMTVKPNSPCPKCGRLMIWQGNKEVCPEVHPVYCLICKRELSVSTDPLSEDCGGDCLACMIETEGLNVWDEMIVKFRNRIVELEKRSGTTPTTAADASQHE